MHTEVTSENMNRKAHLQNLGVGRWTMVQWSGADWMHLAHAGNKQLL